MFKDADCIRLFQVSQTRHCLGLSDNRYPEDRAYAHLQKDLDSLSLGQRISRFNELLVQEVERSAQDPLAASSQVINEEVSCCG
ncbi:hypothetical protein MnBA_38630 [Marinobacterium sp. BA1]